MNPRPLISLALTMPMSSGAGCAAITIADAATAAAPRKCLIADSLPPPLPSQPRNRSCRLIVSNDIYLLRDTITAMSPIWFQILLTLADADRHGLAVMQDVLERT